MLRQRQPNHEQTLNDEGCLLYQANMYEDALQRFTLAIQTAGFQPLVAYNIAICHFKRRENSQALNYIGEIVERGIRNYPELGVGAQVETEGGARSVGNPASLAASALTQALNLKAAIEYQEGSVEAAREALMDLPPRSEPELDPVTLHNMALTEPAGAGEGLRRLAFLMELGPPTCPPETFTNILLMCCKHEMYDTAADILAENTHLTYKYLSSVSVWVDSKIEDGTDFDRISIPFIQYVYDLLDALITSQTSPEDAEQKLGILASSLAGRLRTLAAKVQECRTVGDQNALRSSLREYENGLEK